MKTALGKNKMPSLQVCTSTTFKQLAQIQHNTALLGTIHLYYNALQFHDTEILLCSNTIQPIWNVMYARFMQVP